MTLQSESGVRLLIVEVSRSHAIKHTHTHTHTSKIPVQERIQHTTTQEVNIHAISGIRTCDPSHKAAEDLRVIPHGHQGRLINLYII